MFVRNTNRVPEQIRLSEAAHIIEGSLEVDSDLEKAANCGADIFVSLAGPAYGTKGTV